MIIWKKLLTGLFWLLIIALLIAPLALIVQISREEMREFATPSAPVLQEVAIGGIYKSASDNVHENFKVSGTFVSGADGYMELNYETVKDARWYVSTGSEIQAGMVIGSANGADITATMDGIIRQMNISAGDCFIKLELFSPVLLKARVDAGILSVLRNSRKLTVGSEKAPVTLVFASRQQNSDGTTDVLLSIDSDEYTYGQVVSALYIYTGRVFDDVVRIDQQCVYQKGSDQWYVRQVTEAGIFIQEVEVEILYFDGVNYFVTGIEADQYFDTGYNIIAGG